MAMQQCVQRAVMAIGVVTSCGCATLANGRHQEVRVVEKPGYSATTTTVRRRPSWWNLGDLIFLNPGAGQGMSSGGQWLAFVALYFGGSVTLDALSGGNSVRPRVVEIILTPQVPGSGADYWPAWR
jgi:hypothetical protein